MVEKLAVSNITIESVSFGSMDADVEGIKHKKILKTLSVVQAVRGSYDIKLGGSAVYQTGEGGVFIAPSSVTQEIVHHNGEDGKMQAQWLFVDAVVNDHYRFDEVFSFPIVLDSRYNEEISILMEIVRHTGNYFEKMRAVYRILEILYVEGRGKEKIQPIKTQIEQFVRENYSYDVKAADIAANLYCSIAQVFRYTHKYFGFSPANYINSIRLQQAEEWLRETARSVTDIAFSVGFSDSSYFSKLFKKFHGDSPVEYRKKYRSDSN